MKFNELAKILQENHDPLALHHANNLHYHIPEEMKNEIHTADAVKVIEFNPFGDRLTASIQVGKRVWVFNDKNNTWA